MCFSINRFHFLLMLIGFLLLFSSCASLIQKTAIKNYKPEKKIVGDYNKYQHDLLYYNEILEDGFPYIDEVVPKNKRKAALQEAIDKLAGDEVDNMDFTIQSGKYLSLFNNQHTRINLKSPTETAFPFRVHIYKNDWYLFNVSREVDSTLIGQKITAINNMSITDLQNQLKEYTYAENETNKVDLVRAYSLYNRPKMLVETGVIADKSDGIRLDFENEDYAYLTPTKKEEIKMYQVVLARKPIGGKNKDIYFYKLFPEQDFAYMQFNSSHDKIDFLGGIKNYVKPFYRPFALGWAKRQMKKKNPSEKIARYYNPKYPIFREFVAEMVDSLNDKNIDNLIIDLRYNPGGSVVLGKQLLYHLTDKNELVGFDEYAFNSKLTSTYYPKQMKYWKEEFPDLKPNEPILIRESKTAFNRVTDKHSSYHIPPNRSVFKGNIYVLADTGTGSAAAILTTLFQDNEIATIIGRTVGNNPIGPTTYTPVKLPKTKARGSVATTFMERPKKDLGNIQQPDHWIEVSLEDLLIGRDPHIQKALELIRKN